MKTHLNFSEHSTLKYIYSFSALLVLSIFFVLIHSCKDEEGVYADASHKLLKDGYGLNKLTFLTKDLEKTRNYYADTLGFNVTKPERFKKGIFDGSMTANASFPGITSIEFLSLVDSLVTTKTPKNISDFLSKHQGIESYVFSTSSATSTDSWLSSRGFVMDSIHSYRTSTKTPKGWSRDDGGFQERSLKFGNNSPDYLPRFLENINTDYPKMQKMWKSYYAYNRSFINHPNGVVGITAVEIVTDSLDVARKAFGKMGLVELSNDNSKGEVQFKIKREQRIIVSKPMSEGSEKSKFVKERGQGVFAIHFEVKNIDSTYQFLSKRLPSEAITFDTIQKSIKVSSDYAYGVQLAFTNESEEQALKAQQLKIGGKLDSVSKKYAAGMYQKYCALCHGENREGYAADNAPSLRSNSLLATAKSSNFLRYTIQFGRANTAMGGYLDRHGGPMEFVEVELLIKWLYEVSDVKEPIKLSREPVPGDVNLGAKIYANNCASCHGTNGEGITAPALGNSMLLATATDEFLKYAIKEGRDGTPMIGFKDSLSTAEIDGVTAFLRSRAAGWNIPKVDSITIPKPEEYVLNPNGKNPNFNLREDLFVPSKQVFEALQDSTRMIILDARSKVAWRQTHIPGAVPVPYYEEPENFVNDLPNDDTWIVVYCACPHAASLRVVNTLKRYNFKKLAIIDEGILSWTQFGYPVVYGQ